MKRYGRLEFCVSNIKVCFLGIPFALGYRHNRSESQVELIHKVGYRVQMCADKPTIDVNRSTGCDIISSNRIQIILTIQY